MSEAPARDQEFYQVEKLIKQRRKLLKHIEVLVEQAVAYEKMLERKGIAIKDSPEGTTWVRIREKK